MYLKPDSTIIKQGDIVDYFYFSVLSKDKLIVLDADSKQQLDYRTRLSRTEFDAISVCRPSSGVIITQTCDVQRREYIQLCPIFTIASLETSLRAKGITDNKIQSIITSLRGNKTNYYFYLEALSNEQTNFPESYVDFQLINSIQRENIEKFPRILSLTDKAAHWFSFSLMSYFGRPYS